jgi:hypothetical protein
MAAAKSGPYITACRRVPSQVLKNGIIGMLESEGLGGPRFQVLEIFLFAQDG